MGQEIVYCCHCQLQLRGRDFEKGQAFRIDALACCLKCAPEIMKSLPNESVEKLLKQMAAPKPAPLSESSRAMPHLPSSSTTLNAFVSGQRPASVVPPAAIAGVVLVLVVGVILVLTSGSKPTTETRSAPTPPPREVSVPNPPPPVPPPPTDPMPRPPVPAVDALRAARDYVRANPADFVGQVELYQRAAESVKGSPGAEEAKRELEAVRTTAKERVAAELGTLDRLVRELCVREEFDPALENIEAARRKLNAPDWPADINRRVQDVKRQASDLFASLKGKALDAHRRGAKEEARSIQDRVAKWGMAAYAAELRSLLEEKAPEPKVAPPSPEAAAFARCRETAFTHALARDYGAAQAELKRGSEGLREPAVLRAAAEDAEALKQAAQALRDMQQTATKWPKGQKLALEFVSLTGSAERVEGSVLRTDPFRVELERSGADPVVFVLSETRAGSLAKALKQSRGTMPTPELRGLALLCLLEGDPDAARVLLEGAEGTIPERIWTWAKNSTAGTAAREQEARALLYAAEPAYEVPAATAEAALKHAALLKDYADTLVVRRNRAFITARVQGAKDFLLFPEDMKAGGSFSWVKNPKTETCVLSATDTDPGKTKDNFVEITFSALPDTEYRCWIYAGACCAETFTFYYQATELVGLPSKEVKDPVACDPESGVFLPVKHTLSSLKKTHAQHTGPKSPARWEWIQLPLPKYSAAGAKKVRILSNQQGFAVGFASISGTKSGHPRETEFKSLESARNQTPGAKPLNRAAPPPQEKPVPSDQTVIFSLDLEGGKKPAILSQGSVAKAPERPENRYCLFGDTLPGGNSPIYMGVGSATDGLFTFEGEELLSFEYWVDSAVNGVSFLIVLKDGSKPGANAPNLVVGKWTRVSMRLADLDPKSPPGSVVLGIYLQALSTTPERKFFVDNVQVVRPRAKK
jgi:hypothetical protein